MTWKIENWKLLNKPQAMTNRKFSLKLIMGVWWFNVRSGHSWIVWKNRASVQPVQGKKNRVDSLSTSDGEKHIPSNSSWCKWNKKCILYCFCNRFIYSVQTIHNAVLAAKWFYKCISSITVEVSSALWRDASKYKPVHVTEKTSTWLW